MVRVPARLGEAVKDLLWSRAWRRRPESINIEVTAACDARCIHCPRMDMDRPTRIMPAPLFHRLIDQASALRVPTLCPNGYGEVCTIPVGMLRNMFGYMRSTGHHFRIVINTNGNRMFAEQAAIFIEHRVHLVNVTIDGATAATAESIRKRLSFGQVEANIKNLITMRDAKGSRYPKVRVGMIAMPQTLREIGPFFDRWRGIADFIGVGGFSSRLASLAPAGGFSTVQGRPSCCVLPFRDLNIWADGKAVLCCEDWNEELVIGDLNTQSLKEIWLGEAVSQVRRQHLKHQGHNVALCAKCDHWQVPSLGARLWS